jgi:NAD(P)-dependent dehydrogenase (short-subunit alcohol dehydrogenase family)
VTGSLEVSSVEDFDQVLNVNLRSVYVLFKAAMPHVVAAKGSVVVVSSDSSFKAVRVSSLVYRYEFLQVNKISI